MAINFILTNDGVSVFVENNFYTISRASEIFKSVMDAIKNGDKTKLIETLTLKDTIIDKISNSLDVNEDLVVDKNTRTITFRGIKMSNLLVDRYFELMSYGMDLTPLKNFIKNLAENPSKRAVDELYGFISACKLPITEDGHFLAYKRVRYDYMDVYTGTMDNSVGKIVSMPRNMVDDDKERTCSYGLHFCSYEYLKHYGGERIMVLKINPRDVVSIPVDYNNSKGRCCRYEVISELDVYNNMPVKTIEEEYYNGKLKDIANKSQPSVSNKVSHSAKAITDTEVIAKIRKRARAGESLASLAREYGVSPRTIGRIRDGVY